MLITSVNQAFELQNCKSKFHAQSVTNHDGGPGMVVSMTTLQIFASATRIKREALIKPQTIDQPIRSFSTYSCKGHGGTGVEHA